MLNNLAKEMFSSKKFVLPDNEEYQICPISLKTLK